jgi:uncharacterized protein (UPF0276 family)
MSKNRPLQRLAPCAGVGLKHDHVAEILSTEPGMGFFEVHAENYMGAGGAPHAQLRALRARYPLSIHGVGLSIGSARPLDRDHLLRLKALDERYEPHLLSEHLAWSSHGDERLGEVFLGDLLPLPYTEETLARVCDHIDEVQATLGRRMLLENPATYVVFETSTISEVRFLREIVGRTGCGLLLDLNNVFVSAVNHGTCPDDYLDAFPVEEIGEIHLAGHAAVEEADGGALLIDAHDRPVSDPVWALYQRLIGRIGGRPTLIEWDNDVPAWPILAAEAARAQALLDREASLRASPSSHAA